MSTDFMTLRSSVNISKCAYVKHLEVTSGYYNKEENHNFYEIVWADIGEINVETENISLTLSENELIILPPCKYRIISAPPTCSPFLVIAGFMCSSKKMKLITEKPQKLPPYQGVIMTRLMRECAAADNPNFDVKFATKIHKRVMHPFGSDQMIRICLEHFIISMIRDAMGHNNILAKAPQRPDSDIQTVRDYISENFRTKITLNKLCTIFSTNKTSLCKNFKKEYGETIFNYIHIKRIVEAKKLIRESKLSLSEISEQIGFESTHYFLRVFKKHTGMTPTEYSKSIRSAYEE